MGGDGQGGRSLDEPTATCGWCLTNSFLGDAEAYSHGQAGEISLVKCT